MKRLVNVTSFINKNTRCQQQCKKHARWLAVDVPDGSHFSAAVTGFEMPEIYNVLSKLMCDKHAEEFR